MLCIKDLHIKPETLKLIEEKVRKSLEVMGMGKNFLNKTAMALRVFPDLRAYDIGALLR